MRRKRALEKAVDYEEVTLLPDVTKSYTEIEIDIELELERELEKDNTIVELPKERYDLVSVIQYLNSKTDKNFRSVESNNRHIRARYKEGYTLEDFKKVVDVMCKQWGKDKKMKSYLRPETLFGSKFDGYLNQTTKKETEYHDVATRIG